MMSITRRQVLAGAASAAAFSSSARAELTTAAIISTAATMASLAIEMMKVSGSEQKRWDAGFLLWNEIAGGQRALLGAVERVESELKNVMKRIGKVPDETVALIYLSNIVNRVKDIDSAPDPESQKYKLAREQFLVEAKSIFGTASVTTVPRVAVAAARALAGINAVVAIERLVDPKRDPAVKEAIDRIEFACSNLLSPTSTLSEYINEFDVQIAKAKTALAADPLYAILIPNLPSPPSSAERDGVRVGNHERCWMTRLPDVSGGDHRRFTGDGFLIPRVHVGTVTPYRRPTLHARAPVEVFAKPVYGGDVFFELSYRPAKEWRSGVWNRVEEHRVSINPATRESRSEIVQTQTDDPAIIAGCLESGFNAQQYPVRLETFNSMLKDAADLIAGRSILIGLRDLTEANLRRCRQLKL